MEVNRVEFIASKGELESLRKYAEQFKENLSIMQWSEDMRYTVSCSGKFFDEYYHEIYPICTEQKMYMQEEVDMKIQRIKERHELEKCWIRMKHTTLKESPEEKEARISAYFLHGMLGVMGLFVLGLIVSLFIGIFKNI